MPSFPKYYDEEIETLPRPQIEGMQEGLILQLIPYVYGRSALVRQTWDRAGVTPQAIRSLAEFREKVPFIDKNLIRRFRDEHHDPFGGLKCAGPPHLRAVGSTSGTTGDPTLLPYAQPPTLNQTKRDLWHIGMRPGDYYVSNLFTFREGIASDRYVGCDFRPINFQHSPAEVPRILKASEEFRPKTIMTISLPMILTVEELAKKQDLDMKRIFSCYEGAVFGGEAPSPRIRKLLESWELEMFEITSLGDVTGAIDCRAHAGCHTWEDLALVECLDPHGDEPVPEGERGELVVTSLQDDVAPLVRYRTDDLVTFTREPCQCGRTHGRIRVVGRKGDELLIAGQSILPRDVTPVVEQIPETMAALYQVIRTAREMDVLRLRVGYAPDALRGSQAELAGRLVERLQAELGVPVSIELTPNAELLKLGPPHKIPRVTQK